MSPHRHIGVGPGYSIHRDEPTTNGKDQVNAWQPADWAVNSDALRSCAQSPDVLHSWDDPDESILDDRRGDLPEFPIERLSPPWQRWIERAAHGTGVTPAHIAVPLLGVASSLIGTARRVRASRSWSEPMTLWACIVAGSGDRKTPALNVTLRAINLIEKSNSKAIDEARRAHETRVQKSKEAHRKWKAELKAALEATPPLDPPPMPIEAVDPGNFTFPRLYATDPTIESLAPLLNVRPRGMTLIRDELFTSRSRWICRSTSSSFSQMTSAGFQELSRGNRRILALIRPSPSEHEGYLSPQSTDAPLSIGRPGSGAGQSFPWSWTRAGTNTVRLRELSGPPAPRLQMRLTEP